MASLLLYSLKSAFVLVLLYVPYQLMLRRESFFRFNRTILLSILLLSLLLPMCNISWLSLDRQPVVHAAQIQLVELGVPVRMLPEMEFIGEARPAAAEGVSLFALLSAIYIIGMVFVLVKRLWQVWRLSRGVRLGTLWRQDEDGVHIFCHANDVSPFSWARNIVISQADYEQNGHEILLHEKGHIRAHHSWDVLLLTFVELVQWWNPLVYMLGISLRDVHEYEADNYVLSQGVSATGYQMLVIKKAVGSGSYAFANNFNHSLTKKRITMMCRKNKSKAWMRARALYVIPAAALALSAFATPKIVSPVEDAVNNLAGKVTEKSAISRISEGKKVGRPPVNLTGPMRIYVDGKEMTPQEAIMAVRGKEIKNVLSTNSDGSVNLSINTEVPDSIYHEVAHNAEFPGGDIECFKFLAEKLRYPKLCVYFGFEGRVYMQVVVEKDGSISNITKVRGPSRVLSKAEVTAYKAENPDASEQPVAGQNLGDQLTEEAIRVLKLMPKWNPARDKQGDAVRSYFYLPIMFRLN